MRIDDGILENVREIRGQEAAEDFIGPQWSVSITPQHHLVGPQRPNIWVRFWQFVLFGWKWEWK